MSRPAADRRRYEVDPQVQLRWEIMRARYRSRRESLGLTQAEVSEAMGRSRDFVSVLENQNSAPNVLTLILWADALGGQVSEVWG